MLERIRRHFEVQLRRSVETVVIHKLNKLVFTANLIKPIEIIANQASVQF